MYRMYPYSLAFIHLRPFVAHLCHLHFIPPEFFLVAWSLVMENDAHRPAEPGYHPPLAVLSWVWMRAGGHMAHLPPRFHEQLPHSGLRSFSARPLATGRQKQWA